MKYLKIIIFSLLVFSCKTKQIIHHTSVDTVFIDRNISVEEKIRIDTVFIELPAIKEQVVRKDSSMLTNKYASSFAYIRNDGLLYHDLHFIPQRINKAVNVIDRIEKKDSIYVKIQKVSVEVPVKIPIPKWKQILMWVGVGAVVFAIYKITIIFV